MRAELERLLEQPGDVRIDFDRITATQSFLDEFVGVVVCRQGQAVVDRLVFAGCTGDVRALLELVIGARLEDHEQLAAAGRASARYTPSRGHLLEA
jgi:hypothetical protein